MAAYTKFNQYVADKNHGVHNFSAHTVKIMLVNSPAPVATNSVKADLTEIAAGNGYSAGGVAMTISSEGQTSGTYKVVLADNTITASGGSIGPFRYAVLYNDTPTSPADPLIAFFDYGSSVTLLAGEVLTLDADGTNGIFTDV